MSGDECMYVYVVVGVHVCVYVCTVCMHGNVCVYAQHFDLTQHVVELYMPSFVKILTVYVCVYGIQCVKYSTI